MSAASSAASGSLAALGQRPPRLVLRVVVYSALILGMGAATLLVFIRHFEGRRAEQTATLQASIVTQAVVDRLRPADVRAPVSPERRRELDLLFRARVLDDETLAAAVVTDGGHRAYATQGARVGSAPLSQEHLEKADAGRVTGQVLSTQIDGATKRVLRTYAPFRLADGSTGVVVVDKDYAPIANSARQAAIAVAAVLEIVLVFLWLCLIPMMRTATRRIHRQLDTIAHLALHDDLTGLPNRAQLVSHLDQVLAAHGADPQLSVLFIDLDRFKEVNDTLGHDRGNELLVEIAKRLGATLGRGELVARLGGDEFAVVSEHAVAETEALALAERLRGVIAELFNIAGISIEPQASIGIALAPEHGTSRAQLLRRADIAMYAAKRAGASRVFEPEYDDHSPVHLAMTSELRQALERRELVVYYQPQVDLRRGQVRSVEALVRWQHPSRGLLEPHAFLPAIEHAGLARRLTGYVLDESLRQLRAWREAGLDLGLAINVSARDLADVDFPDEIAHALAEYGIEPSSVELEITENLFMLDSVRVGKSLDQIIEQGLRIAIDDFGVGYSSLGQLKNFPAHVLKIDRSFVTGMASDRRDAAIVSSTIGLAHQLGLEVVAEGIETPDHVSQLYAAGCDLGQGFHLGRPLPFGASDDAARLTAAAAAGVTAGGADVLPLRRVAG